MIDSAAGLDRIDVLTERVAALPGRALRLDLSGDECSELADRLDIVLDDERGGAQVRSVFGAACTTAAKTVDQFVAALQLPYRATRGWTDFLAALGERPASRRSCLVIADACQLLKHEDHDRWRELVQELSGGPYCLGGGWSTLVLADHEASWRHWVFRSAATAPSPGQELLRAD